jgi:ABC-2 type transport system ATP-binding protein
MSKTPAIHAEGLGKTFGEVQALQGVDLAVPTGSVVGLLGHNSAGRTTTVRILTTPAPPRLNRPGIPGRSGVPSAPGMVVASGRACRAGCRCPARQTTG